MPYEQRTSPPSVAPNHDDLVGAITTEFTSPPKSNIQKRAAQFCIPHIIEAVIRNTDRLEVYVVWDKWSGIPEEHRTNAILDAYKKAPDPGKVNRVVIALGVTPDEARNLGIIN